nr:MAG TPA: hypothetical protein [Caudoviricetes sp.]
MVKFRSTKLESWDFKSFRITRALHFSVNVVCLL